jgi:hypothetical protein
MKNTIDDDLKLKDSPLFSIIKSIRYEVENTTNTYDKYAILLKQFTSNNQEFSDYNNIAIKTHESVIYSMHLLNRLKYVKSKIDTLNKELDDNPNDEELHK